MTTSRSYEERHAAAEEVLSTMQAGKVDVQRATRAFYRRNGALGSFAVDVVMGDVWSRPQLSRRDRSLIVIGMLAAQGSTEELGAHVEIGLNHGLSRDEVEEILLHVAAYAGYPMAMSASRVVDRTFLRLDGVERLPERAPAESKSDAQRRAAAADVIGTLTGGRAAADPEEAFANIVGSLGDVGRLAFEWAFGEVWCRPQLSRRDRSLLVIAILAWLSRERELAFHVPAGLNHGLTREEITEVTVQLCIYGGFPRAVDAYHAVQEAFATIDRRAGS